MSTYYFYFIIINMYIANKIKTEKYSQKSHSQHHIEHKTISLKEH